MKTSIHLFASGVCLFAMGSTCIAEDVLTPQQQIEQGAKAFVEAFNQGDAKAIAEFWTEDGDYVDESGQRFTGREAIEDEYAAFFAAHPGSKLKLTIDSIRLLGSDVAIEDGRAIVSPPAGSAPAQSRYTAVHIKCDGQWRISSVRDARIELPSTYERLADLEFLVGQWQAEHLGVAVEIECEWNAGKSFLEREYNVRENGHPVSSGTEVIGWDPRTQTIKSWTFSSDGGHAEGLWTPHDVGWIVETAGVTSDGVPTTAVNVLSHVDADAMAWKSLRRSRGNVALPDTSEIILKRKPTNE